MEAYFETLVMYFLTCGGNVFISPQYDVKFDKEHNDGGSVPDVTALDYSCKQAEVVVVEITSASNISSLYHRIEKREANWFAPVRRRLVEKGIIKESCHIRFLGFVRKEVIEQARKKFQGNRDVAFFALEDAVFAFNYWAEREGKSLPR